MLNQNEILSTLEMLRNEHLDVRTVTLGVNLFDCISSRLPVFTDNVETKIERLAGRLVAVCDQIGEKYGIPVVNKRISVSPIAVWPPPFPPDRWSAIAQALDAAADGSVDLSAGSRPWWKRASPAGDRALIEAIPEALTKPNGCAHRSTWPRPGPGSTWTPSC
jgi:uncharacterized protein (UPF0210 family)